MKSFRVWVTVSFLWLPLLISLVLNPGRNGSNIGSFSDAKLFTLAVCGCMLVLYGLAGFTQPRYIAFAFGPTPLAPSRMLVMLFAMLLGVLALYESYRGLGLG